MTHGSHCVVFLSKVRKVAKIKNGYNQVPHLTLIRCLVLVQPRKTGNCPDRTEKLLTGM